MFTRFASILPVACALALCSCKVYRPTPTSDEFRNSFSALNRVQIVQQLTEQQAPMEFDCPQAEMTFKSPGNPNRMIATGCGKRATYQFVNTVGWVLNTDIQPYEAPSSARSAEAAEATP